MPTISGLRRRGYTPESIKNFSDAIGVTKRDAIVDVAKLENSLREDLNKKAPRVMGVLEPVKVVITNYPDNKIEYIDAKNNPEDESAGKRKLAFSKEIFIDKNDFMDLVLVPLGPRPSSFVRDCCMGGGYSGPSKGA